MTSIECYFNEEYAAMARGETRIGSAENLVLGSTIVYRRKMHVLPTKK